MSRQHRVRRFVIVGLTGVLLMLGWPSVAQAAVVDALLEDPLEAARGLGWAVHPDQTPDDADPELERFVEGPLTPPSGRGSLEMTAPTSADRALIFTVPKPSTGVDIGGIAAFIATSWEETSGSFSTFTTNTTEPATAIPGLLLVGFQDFDPENPVLSEEFTVLHVEGGEQTEVAPAPEANTWQTWTLNDQARVWQSNTSDGECLIDLPCSFRDFKDLYPNGAWGQIQVGMGTGLPADSEGYVDNVQVSDGTTTFVADFEVPAAQNSTATIAAGAATATGGSVGITLNSSELAALGSTEFTITFSGTSAASPAPVTVPAGDTATQTFPLPFGTTQVTVQAQGVTLASTPVTFQAPTTVPPPTTPTTAGTPTAATGSTSGATGGARLSPTG